MQYKITPSGSSKAVIVEANSMIEVADKVKSLGIAAKITKVESSGKWDRKEFDTMAQATDYAKAQGRGTVKHQNGKVVWYAAKK